MISGGRPPAGTGIRGDLTRLVNCPHLALYPPQPADQAAAGAERPTAATYRRQAAGIRPTS
jgi:hypothetical protein